MPPLKNTIAFLLLITSVIFSSANTDSLGIKTEDGKKFIMHRVENDETLFSLGQRYDVTVKKLKEINPQTKEELVVGEVILVPYKPEKEKGKYHRVKSDETLYSISQQYDVEVQQIKQWNNLKNNNIEPGQKLKVGPGKKESGKKNKSQDSKSEPDSKNPESSEEKEPEEKKASKPVKQPKPDKPEDKPKPDRPEKQKAEKDTDSPEEKPDSRYAKKFKENLKEDQMNNSGEMVSKSQEGKATWLNESNISTDKSLALHRSAPPGTIIKITNMKNDKVVYVKTVGKLNQNEDKSILITISPKAAEKLKVNEDFFRAKLEYSYKKSSN